jgi:hypothetical protein
MHPETAARDGHPFTYQQRTTLRNFSGTLTSSQSTIAHQPVVYMISIDNTTVPISHT